MRRASAISSAAAVGNASKKFHLHETFLPQAFENMLVGWIIHQRSKKPPLPISHLILQEKANEASKFFIKKLEAITPLPSHLDKQLKALSQCTFSAGWASNFCKRFHVASLTAHGEGGSVNEADVNSCRRDLQEMLSSYALSDIYNADEFALFFQLLPTRSLEFIKNRSTRRGNKPYSGRLTGLVCCNADGSHKIKPLVIGHAQTPRALKYVNKVLLPCSYTFSENAWMTMNIFNDWLETFNNTMMHRDKSVILLIDGAPGHNRARSIQLSNTKVYIFPGNLTSHVQPCDAGIIRSLKSKYRQRLVKRMLRVYEQDESYIKMDINQAIRMLAAAWDEVETQCIQNCWIKTGILPPSYAANIRSEREPLTSATQLGEEILHKLSNLNLDNGQPLNFEDYVDIEQKYETEQHEPLSEENLYNDALRELGIETSQADANENPQAEVVQVASDDEDTDSKEAAQTTNKEAIAAAEVILSHIQQQDNMDSEKQTELMIAIQRYIEDTEEKMLKSKKQSSIRDYFQ